jgi:O-antigen ligase
MHHWQLVEWLILGMATPVFWFPQQAPLVTGGISFLVAATWVTMIWRRRCTPPQGFELPLLAILSAVCLASIPVFDRSVALPKLLGIALGSCVLVKISDAVKSRRDLEVSLSVTALAALLLAISGLFAADWTVAKVPLLQPILSRLPGLLRAYVPNTGGAGLNPNELAGALSLMIPVLASGAILSQRQHLPAWNMTLLSAAAACDLLVMLASESRAALAGLSVSTLVAMGLGVLRRPAGRLRNRLLIFYVGLIAVSAWIAWRAAQTWMTATSDSVVSLDSFSARVEIWRSAVAMAIDFPLTGIGIGQFNPVMHLFYPSSLIADQQPIPHAHNLLLAYVVELGIPGACAMSALVVLFLRACFRAARSPDRLLSWTGISLGLGMLAFAIFGLVDAIAPGARGGLVLWIILGLGFAMGNVASETRAPHRRRR